MHHILLAAYQNTENLSMITESFQIVHVAKTKYHQDFLVNDGTEVNMPSTSQTSRTMFFLNHIELQAYKQFLGTAPKQRRF